MEIPAKIQVDVGKKASEKLVDAVIDTFSPATESLGLLGDAVRLARVEIATKLVQRAKAMADENGLQLIAPPLKFLVPFFERSSTENGEDNELLKMWASLLYTSGVSYRDRNTRYISILGEMNSNQATLLKSIVEDEDRVYSIIKQMCYDMIPANISYDIDSMEHNGKDIINTEVFRKLSHPGILIEAITIDYAESPKNEDSLYDLVNNLEVSKNRLDLEILRSHGLINYVALGWRKAKFFEYAISFYHITELGFDFLTTCDSPNFDKTRSSSAP